MVGPGVTPADSPKAFQTAPTGSSLQRLVSWSICLSLGPTQQSGSETTLGEAVCLGSNPWGQGSRVQMEASIVRLASGALGARVLLLEPSGGTWGTLLWGPEGNISPLAPIPRGLGSPTRLVIYVGPAAASEEGQKWEVGTLGAMKCPLGEAAGAVVGEGVGLGGWGVDLWSSTGGVQHQHLCLFIPGPLPEPTGTQAYPALTVVCS